MKRLVQSLMILTVAAATFGSATLAIMLVDKRLPTEYRGARSLAPIVARGATIEIEYDVIRTQLCETRGLRWLVDAKGVQHSIANFTADDPAEMGEQFIRRIITVPESAALGPASYFVEVEYICNFVHRLGYPLTATTPPVNFEIVGALDCVAPKPVLVRSYCRAVPVRTRMR